MREGDPDVDLPIDQLCESIVSRYHADLHRTLPLIQQELRLVKDDIGTDPRAEARAAIDELVRQLHGHLSKEENLLFPAFMALAQAEREGRPRPPLPFSTVLHPIRMMEAEHERIEASMVRLRALTHSFVAASDADPAWRNCLARLSRLDADLHEHHRKENEELFPRALELERRLP